MVKGVIERVESNYSYRVRIPIIHKVENTPGAVATEDLPIAPVCTSPGINPTYQVGDIVWLDFENDEMGMPVIVGILYREEPSKAIADINCSSINVEVDTTLPEDTKIGATGYKSIQALPNIIDRINNIQEQLEYLTNNSVN